MQASSSRPALREDSNNAEYRKNLRVIKSAKRRCRHLKRDLRIAKSDHTKQRILKPILEQKEYPEEEGQDKNEIHKNYKMCFKLIRKHLKAWGLHQEPKKQKKPYLISLPLL